MLENIQTMKIANVEKQLVDKLVEECTEKVEEAKLAEINLKELHSAEHEKVRKSSCTIYVVLIAIIFTINIIIGTYFVYYKCMNRNKENVSRYDYVYQTTSYQYK